ncbi:MAG: DUF4215 domain-containing protein [Candidatus Binatia bacterium]|nr:DUF4215 domain-containing protein [Candidatus Binatia bacterium]
MPRLNGIIFGTGLLVATSFATPAGAVSIPADFCSGDPCTITGTVNADAGSVVDFGARSLVFGPSARVVVGAGALPRVLTLIAEDISMAAGSEIRGFDADRAVVTLQSTVGSVTMASSGSNRAEINVKADTIDGGSITITSAADAIIGGRLTASAQGEDASAGNIEVTAAGMVVISEEITTKGSGLFAGGGDISVTAGGDITATNKVFAEGSDFGGGDVTFETTSGSISISELVSNNGGNPDGEAGEYTFDAPLGDFHLTATGEIRGKGGAGADDDCGDGASTFITVGGSVSIDGLVDIPGGFQCFGGDFTVAAGIDFIQNGSGKISTATGGGFGAGGVVEISATHSATLRKVDASSAGFGGDIDVTTGLFIEAFDKLNSKATGAEGVGGRISLISCSVDVVSPDGELDSRGPYVFPGFGKNLIKVSGASTISGDMLAATENEIRYLFAAPTVTGSIDPAAIITLDQLLLPCENTCGDESVESPEICDDGNISGCDGCSSDCSRVDDVCGDGIKECGEQCDDGNATPGDGCENDCTPTGQEESGVLIESSGKKVGCQAQWLLQISDPDTDKKGKPAAKQVCTDGDTRCDADGVTNSSCSFLISPCLNIPDDDLPECNPSRRVDRIILKKPLPGSNSAQDDANAQAVVASLLTLGTTVEADGAVLSSGGPVSGATVCGPAVEVEIPFTGKSGKKTFKLRTENEVGQTLKKAQVQLKCERNDAVCGNSVLEVGEACDDGNITSCDGCSSCQAEICGNGTVECTEQCDEGLLNGTEGSACNATCEILAPDLRIPGGGSKKTDCMWQWSMEIGAGDLKVDKKGNARNKQTCRDGNPQCDLDPAPGNCRVRVFGCAAAKNDAISCLAQSVDSLDIKRPKVNAKTGWEIAARATMDTALGDMPFPLAAGEVCSSAMDIDIPQGEKLRVSVKAFGVKKDGDSLKIDCE